MPKKDSSNSSVMTKENNGSEEPHAHKTEDTELPESNDRTPFNRLAEVASETARSAEPYDPFSEENIRLPQELLDEAVATTELNIIPVQKPTDQQFIRVHPDPAYQHVAAIIELREESGAKYLVHPTCLAEVKGYGIKFYFMRLYLCETALGNYFFWPVKLPTSTRENRWLTSAVIEAENATRKWICVRSDTALGAYVGSVAKDNASYPDPEWPAKDGVPLTKNQLLSKAFRERLIMSVDHPVIQKLIGAIVK